jgi:hypothetical protein
MENEMDDVNVTYRTADVQTRDPVDVLAGIDRAEERLVPAERELKSGFELAWELAH